MRLLVLFLIVLISSCSSTGKKEIRIGVDPGWHSINSYGQVQKINGFVEELLMDLAGESGCVFVRVATNWDSLTDDLLKGRIDAVISTMPPYNFNHARFAFSKNILDLGPVCVVPASSSVKVKNLEGKRIGVLADDQNIQFVQKIPNVIMHEAATIPALLDLIIKEELDAAILDRLLVLSYVQNLYSGKLKVIEPPLSEFGLHFVALKKEESKQIAAWNKLLKKKKIKALQEKWQL